MRHGRRRNHDSGTGRPMKITAADGSHSSLVDSVSVADGTTTLAVGKDSSSLVNSQLSVGATSTSSSAASNAAAAAAASSVM